MKPIRPHASRKNQAGVGLLEILIAVLVLSLGLLGMAGLQARSLQQNQSSMMRSHAVALGYSILDGLRLDRDAAMAGTYNLALTCVVPAATGQLAGDTLNLWMSDLRRVLGQSASTCGFINCAANGICTVRIRWDDSRAGGSATEEYEIRTRL